MKNILLKRCSSILLVVMLVLSLCLTGCSPDDREDLPVTIADESVDTEDVDSGKETENQEITGENTESTDSDGDAENQETVEGTVEGDAEENKEIVLPTVPIE